LVVAIDQVTKAWIRATIAPGESVSVVGDTIRLVHGQNDGALFGLASIVVIGLIVVYHGRSGRSRYMSVALGLLLGGAIGNLIDRVAYGYVIDFVDVYWRNHHCQAFNVADSCISIGVGMLILDLLRAPAEDSSPEGPVASRATSPGE